MTGRIISSKKHPEIAIRRTEAFDRIMNRALDEDNINFYFSTLTSAFQKCEELSNGNNLARNRIFAMDETAIQANKRLGYVIAQRGAKNVISLCSENREHLTVVRFASPLGVCGRPIFITPRHIPNFLESHFTGSKIVESDSGYINDKLFAELVWFFRAGNSRNPRG